MKFFRNEEQLEKEFHVSRYIVIYKFILGVVEFLSGIVLAAFGSRIYQSVQSSLLRELSEDPHDLLARLSEMIVPNLLAHNTYVIVYLILLGLAKIAGVIGLMFQQNWGVDLLVGLTLLMAPFQIVHLLHRPNWFDLIYFIVGILIALYLVEFKPQAWVSRVVHWGRSVSRLAGFLPF